MTVPTRPDHDRLVRTFLEAGPEVLSDRTLDAIADDVHRTRQRGGGAVPWRIPSMSRFTITAASVAIVAVIAGLAFMISRPTSHVGGPSIPPSTASPTPTASPTSPPDPLGFLEDGGTYRTTAGSFSQSFTVTLPRMPAALADNIFGDLLGSSHDLRIRPKVGAITIHDDSVLPADFCNPDGGVIKDIPATPQAVQAWLAKGLIVSPPVELTVDGRTALRWDVFVPASCHAAASDSSTGAAIWFGPREHHRLYAVPTGRDTILIATWGAGYEGGEPLLGAINTWADSFVEAMQFH
jgi:hypothetical protein